MYVCIVIDYAKNIKDTVHHIYIEKKSKQVKNNTEKVRLSLSLDSLRECNVSYLQKRLYKLFDHLIISP